MRGKEPMGPFMTFLSPFNGLAQVPSIASRAQKGRCVAAGCPGGGQLLYRGLGPRVLRHVGSRVETGGLLRVSGGAPGVSSRSQPTRGQGSGDEQPSQLSGLSLCDPSFLQVLVSYSYLVCRNNRRSWQVWCQTHSFPLDSGSMFMVLPAVFKHHNHNSSWCVGL